ncbi:hypothetical protein RFI_23193 [Reticulomyxa filosa]|uniref:Uncharacterized protein n=1 Tax=Reticulomyxa filosa TaxID=46433 RepID=X6ML44_RETFI|nr:hypothetical protein RFI_23193 [Reticulomyxa filosa]|eukprot:ETO14177.1 hypothetical protein RFI_23193 [Reticulomyxa filosa]
MSVATQKFVRKLQLAVVTDNPRHAHDFSSSFLHMQKEIRQTKEEYGHLIKIAFERNLANINNDSRVANFQIHLSKIMFFENLLKHIDQFAKADLIVVCMPAPRLPSQIHHVSKEKEEQQKLLVFYSSIAYFFFCNFLKRIYVLELVQRCLEHGLNCQELFEKLFFCLIWKNLSGEKPSKSIGANVNFLLVFFFL